VSAAADATLEHRSDDSHSTTEWLPAPAALVGHALYEGALRVGLRIRDLSLLILDRSGHEILAQSAVEGLTLPECLNWVSAAIHKRTGAPPPRPLALRDYDMPDHPAAKGEVFAITAHEDALEELSRWYDNANTLLRRLQATTPNTSTVACWPHHFDIATLITMDAGPENGRSIGVGLSPGDRYFPEPYWYVSPWPRPEIAARPALDSSTDGRWADFGAVLLGSDLVGDGSASTQASKLRSFVHSAIKTARALISD
jgi:hypothetical protein